MTSARLAIAVLIAASFISDGLGASASVATESRSQVVSRELRSDFLAHGKINTDPVRRMVVYLPPGYEGEVARYPVIYFLPNPFGSYRTYFDERGARGLFDRAIARGAIGKFIFVSVDMNTPIGCSWYVNSPVTGNWEDFYIRELVPYVDANFRTLPGRDSRGIAGDFMGGYGALSLGMKHADVFGSIYALHPVGTGSGVQIMESRPNWDLLTNAKTLDDVKSDGFTQIFTSIFQAHLPNPDRPPLFIDLPARKVGDRLVIDASLTNRLRENFFIESKIPAYADNLKSLRGLMFDWARNDSNQDHVYANQALTHKLNEYGIVHEAEEYNGAWGEPNWGEEGRVNADMLPFFERHLAFESK